MVSCSLCKRGILLPDAALAHVYLSQLSQPFPAISKAHCADRECSFECCCGIHKYPVYSTHNGPCNQLKYPEAAGKHLTKSQYGNPLIPLD